MPFIQAENLLERQKAMQQQQLAQGIGQGIQNAVSAYGSAQDKQRALASQQAQQVNELAKEQRGQQFQKELAGQAQESARGLAGLNREQKAIDTKQAQDFTAGQNQLNRENTSRIAASKGELAQGKASDKMATDLKKVGVQGFDIADPNIIPTSKDAEELKKMNESNLIIDKTVSELQELIKSGGVPTGLPTEHRSMVNQKLNNLLVAGKNVDQLGALSGPDMGLELAQVGDVTGPKGAFLGKDNAIAMLENFRQKSKDKVLANSTARGYVQKGQVPIQQNPVNQVIDPSQDSGFAAWKKAKGL